MLNVVKVVFDKYFRDKCLSICSPHKFPAFFFLKYAGSCQEDQTQRQANEFCEAQTLSEHRDLHRSYARCLLCARQQGNAVESTMLFLQKSMTFPLMSKELS